MKRFLIILALCSGAAASRAEELAPVIVAAVDIPAGQKVTPEMISQRSIPKPLVTKSLVTPDGASYIFGQSTRRAVLAGDLLSWSNFDPVDPRVVEVCTKKLSSTRASATEQVRRARAAVTAPH